MAGDPRQVREAMRTMEANLQRLVEPTEMQMREAERAIENTTTYLQNAENAVRNAMEQCQRDIDACEDMRRDGYDVNCGYLYYRYSELERTYRQLVTYQQQLRKMVDKYQSAAGGARQVIYETVPSACHWLREREAALKKFDTTRGIATSTSQSKGSQAENLGQFGRAAIASGNPALLSAFLGTFEGMGTHGYKYKRARQEFLRSLVNDPKQPRHVRGWVQQELNRIDYIKRARAEGRTFPGRTSTDIKGIPGLDVGHRYPGLDIAENFHLEDASVNRRRPILARRMGIDHLFR
jgi:hypothetical protein